MAPPVITSRAPAQGEYCEPFGQRPADWAAVAMAILLVGFVVLAWWRIVWQKTVQDEEVTRLRARLVGLSEQAAPYRAARHRCEQLHMLLEEERQAADSLRRDAAQAMAKAGFLQDQVVAMARKLQALKGEAAASPVPTSASTAWSPGARGLGIRHRPDSTVASELPSSPNLTIFRSRVMGFSPSPDSAAALDAIQHRRGAGRSLRIDTAVAPQKHANPPVARRQRTIPAPGLVPRRKTGDGLVEVGPENAHAPMRACIVGASTDVTKTPPPYASHMSRPQRAGNLADELAGMGADDSYFAIGSAGDSEEEVAVGKNGSGHQASTTSPALAPLPEPPVSPVSPGAPIVRSDYFVSPIASPDAAGQQAKGKQRMKSAHASPSMDNDREYAEIQEARRITLDILTSAREH